MKERGKVVHEVERQWSQQRKWGNWMTVKWKMSWRENRMDYVVQYSMAFLSGEEMGAWE